MCGWSNLIKWFSRFIKFISWLWRSVLWNWHLNDRWLCLSNLIYPDMLLFKPKFLLLNIASAEEAGVKCPVCSKVFHGPHRKGVLTTHLNTIHLKARSWHCVFCGRIFHRNDSRRRHQSTCYKNPAAKKESPEAPSFVTDPDLMCKYCHQKFTTVKKRAAHEWRCGRFNYS